MLNFTHSKISFYFCFIYKKRKYKIKKQRRVEEGIIFSKGK